MRAVSRGSLVKCPVCGNKLHYEVITHTTSYYEARNNGELELISTGDLTELGHWYCPGNAQTHAIPYWKYIVMELNNVIHVLVFDSEAEYQELLRNVNAKRYIPES